MRLHEKYLQTEKVDEDGISNYIRDEMSGTRTRSTATEMLNDMKRFGIGFKSIKKAQFMKVWKRLVKEKYMKKVPKNKFDTEDRYEWVNF